MTGRGDCTADGLQDQGDRPYLPERTDDWSNEPGPNRYSHPGASGYEGTMSDGDDEPKDILLVEDNPGDVRLTEEAFKEGKFNTTLHVTTDGIEALDFLLQRNKYTEAPRPDIVLLDLNLPRLNGDKLLNKIRADSTLRCLPIIIFSGSSAKEEITKSYQLQANAFLTKPVNPVEFIETIKSFQQFWLSNVQLPSCERQ